MLNGFMMSNETELGNRKANVCPVGKWSSYFCIRHRPASV